MGTARLDGLHRARAMSFGPARDAASVPMRLGRPIHERRGGAGPDLRRVRHGGRLAQQRRARARGAVRAARRAARLAAFADRWRALYQPAMEAVTQRPSAVGQARRAASREPRCRCWPSSTSAGSTRRSSTISTAPGTGSTPGRTWSPGSRRLKRPLHPGNALQRQRRADGQPRAPRRRCPGTRSSAPRSRRPTSRCRRPICGPPTTGPGARRLHDGRGPQRRPGRGGAQGFRTAFVARAAGARPRPDDGPAARPTRSTIVAERLRRPRRPARLRSRRCRWSGRRA